MSAHVLSQTLSRNDIRLREPFELPTSSTAPHECLTSLTKASRDWYFEVAAVVMGELLWRICDKALSLKAYMSKQENRLRPISLTSAVGSVLRRQRRTEHFRAPLKHDALFLCPLARWEYCQSLLDQVQKPDHGTGRQGRPRGCPAVRQTLSPCPVVE